ncbi:unnamed protein product [Nyctereutes procyonoides]|uniref:(raccoon dog) hypothetical protein n=1 Tax=Nyctereutes procyonoides TaxID=34880 RepID=A0A811ZHQ4_NYCPR|nr:unnamed protein product [Nyctereutes procyonoides]CAD7688246.1 unnamed protein product [Nyctereutes procyonoides]
MWSVCLEYHSAIKIRSCRLLYVFDKDFYIGDILPIASHIKKNYHKLCGLKQQTFILSQLWSSEVQNQNVCRAALPWEPLGENLSSSLALEASRGGRNSLICGLKAALLQSLPLWSHCLVLCVSVL